MPQLSIVTINLNNKAGLEKTIKSVINQSFTDYEYLIIDGGSTDGSLDLISKYAEKISYWVSEPDRGIYDAMNKALHHATGIWINFLNSGDTYYQPDTIARIFEQKISTNYDAILGNIIIRNGTQSTSHNYNEFLMKITYRYCHQAVFIRTSCHKLFNTNYKIVADLDILIDFMNSKRIKYLDYIVVNYQDDGVSKTNLLLLHRERKEVIIKKGIWFLIPFELYSYFKFWISNILTSKR